MKNSYSFFFSPLFFLAVFLCSFQNISAQEEKYKQGNLEITKQNTNELDTPELRAKMKADGLSSPVIDRLIAQRKLWVQQGRNVSWTNVQRNNQTPVVNATCGDLGVENGWSAWQWQNGNNSGSNPPVWGGAPAANPASSPAGPGGSFYTITGGAGIDPNTPGPNPGDPPVPVVCPGFGNSSIKIGDDCGVNSNCNQLTYPLTVTAQDTNFIYAYAIVLEDAGHLPPEQPWVSLCVYDSGGNPLNCGCFKYTGGSNIPGFYNVSGTGCANGALDHYKPWTLAGINLSAYIGQTVSIVITNCDCIYGGHFAYSYWDFSCGSLSTNPASYCLGQQVSITAPVDPNIAYTYQWTQNGNPYTGAPSATAQTITPFPQPGDTFVVEVIQPSGCNFHVAYVPQPMSITPNFNYVVNCGTVTFTDSSMAPGNSIVGWNWSFPGGNPATSTLQNPTSTFPAGNYTVTLIATAQSGCKDTISLPVSVTGLPVAAFSVTTVCAGNPTQFTNSSVSAAGDPITGWSWSFPGGNPLTSTAQNPSVTYPPGNYTASLTVTSQAGCTSSVTQSVTVNPLPVPNFTSTIVCFNNATVFTDQSTGPAVQWDWNFGDGNTSALQSPSHTYANPGNYTVTLVATNSFGCKDSVKKNIIVNPVPAANFSSVPVCFGSSTCFTDASTIAYGNVTGWSWNFNDPNSGLNNISNLQNPCHVFTGLGPYNVLLTITSDSGCQSNTTLQALINPPPVAAFTNSSVCLNSPTSFTNTSSPANANDPITGWNWNFGDGSPSSTVVNPSHNYTTAGNYTVTLIITSQLGCKDTVDNPIIVYSNPIANFAHPDSGCAPVCEKPMTDLSQGVSGNIATWEWSFPGGGNPSSSTSSAPNVCWSTPGIYDVQLIVTTQYGCKDTMLIPKCIHVFSWPTADFCVNPAQTSVHTPDFTFCNLWSSDVVNWTWNFGDNSPLDSTQTAPVHSYSATTTSNDYYTYNICLNVQNQHGCWDTICKTVELIPEFEFFIPNCFTPNGDDANEFFFGKGRGIKDYNIWVFDRWGNQIWDCHYVGKNVPWDYAGKDGMSSACKWDGIVVSGGVDMNGNTGQLAQEDVYVWKVKLTDIFDKVHEYIGHVSIVK